jgi:ubiquitin carboxyl-terminal hydrolase 4/11/15
MFFEEEETDTATTDDLDPDLVISNGSDSSGEGKIVAHSIDGDDSIVDITMKEPSEATVGEASEPEPIKPS